MRSAVTMAGLMLFVAACGSSNNTTGASAGSSTGAEASDGGGTTGGGTTGSTTTGGGDNGSATTGGGYMDAGLVDGTQCSDDLACASHVCGLAGTGNCCSIKCASTNAACTATACDSNGTCIYPSSGATGGALPACGGSCMNSQLNAYFCDTSGNCSVSTGQALPCPGDYACDTAGTACKTTCAADSDCAPKSYCLGGNCALRETAGPCAVNDACTTGICGLSGTGNCCKAACAPTADSACDPTGCDATTAACTYPAGNACGAPTCVNSTFTLQGGGSCSAAGVCVTAPAPCANNFGCNPGGTACNTTCTLRSDCATGFYCNAGACIPEIPVGSCFENAECVSNVCGAAANGNCCAAQCAPTKDPKCNPINCDATAGGCLYPAGFACGGASCVNAVLNFACDTGGNCDANTTPCANNYACNAAGTNCNSTCAADSDCVSGFYCNTTSGACIPQQAVGACSANDQCLSEICGISGTGHCCGAACTDTAAACAASDCGATTGSCIYATSAVACGSTLASCANGVENNPSVCDGAGNCPTPGTTNCSPYICNSNGLTCLNKCTDATSCATGDFCDVGKSACCSALASNGTITVDAKTGKDNGCCGINGNTACLTITRAMSIIDSAQASNVTINASIGGNGGNWAPKGETYPITLGWGAELSAPGVYFYDANGNAEIFDINFYSANDTIGYASIVGSAGSTINIGWDNNENQSSDSSAIMVEASNTLYIANALVNGSSNNATNAITVAAGASLTLGQDQADAVTGTVDIGTTNQDGWNGIVCQTDAVSLGCTITDANLNGTTSVNIQFQDNMDIDAEDFASISLTSNPIIGAPPSAAGFLNCSSKNDVSAQFYQSGQAVWLNGDATMTFNNGTVQCISGNAFTLNTSPNSNGNPTLNMTGTTVQNVEYGVMATAGSATITNSTFEYLFTGVLQGTDGTNSATVDLSGGTSATTNTVVCANSAESVGGAGGWGISASAVVDETTSNLNASNVNWDTTVPDQFSCTNLALTNCTCVSSSCADSAGVDGMDAVYENTGTVTTTGNGAATQDCTPPAICGPGTFNAQYCASGSTCCQFSVDFFGFACCAPGGDCFDYCPD